MKPYHARTAQQTLTLSSEKAVFSERKQTRASAKRESNCDSVNFKNSTRSPAGQRPETQPYVPVSAAARKLEDRTSPGLNCRTTTVKEPGSVSRCEVQSFNQAGPTTARASRSRIGRQQLSDLIKHQSSEQNDSAWKRARNDRGSGVQSNGSSSKFEITRAFPD